MTAAKNYLGVDHVRIMARQYAAGLALAFAVVSMTPDSPARAAGVGIVRQRQWTGRFDPAEMMDTQWVLTVPLSEETVQPSPGLSLN
jgi:hypothetical protein